jgi:hypothetical protein
MSERDNSSSPLVLQESGVAKKCHSLEDLERKAVRRMDYNILPVMSMFYLLSFLVSARGNPFNFGVEVISSRIEQI